MKRQDSLAVVADTPRTGDTPGSQHRSDNPFINKILPSVTRTTAGLEPYTGPWGRVQAAHLLRRTLFGPGKSEIDQLVQMTMSDGVDLVLAQPPGETSQPLTTDSRDMVPVGTTWVNSLYRDLNSSTNFNPTSIRTTSLKAWWAGLMVNQQLSVREKMVLFWHNHFVTETATVADPRFSYRYLALLRSNAIGNFKSLARQITTDGAMLRYLNGNTNTKSSPNENYGRELQELFTIGKGPEIAPGDYTYYTEADVKAAARVLTGWRDTTNSDGTLGSTTSSFTASRHDTTDKQFSAHYGNTVIKGGTDGGRELDDLITMIFAQQETAMFMCRKLYRWFVYYVIDATTEANVITPMANLLVANNYDILPVLSVLLKSAHFYDPVNIGCMIKSPMDMIIGVARQLPVAIPTTPLATQYAMWNYLISQGNVLDMLMGDPPNVAGWAAYYQDPEYYELWVNSDTLPKRTRFTDTLIQPGYTNSGATIQIDVLGFVKSLSDPSDPNVIVDESAQHLFAIPITATQRSFLKETLLPGLPDYEWTVEWEAYLNNPTDPTASGAVQSKLRALVRFMMEMPEFQLM